MNRPFEPTTDNDNSRPPVDERVLEELGHNLMKEYGEDDELRD